MPEITILSTMVASFVGEGEWGFAALLEFPDEAILFDTGFKADTVKANAHLLDKDLAGVNRVVLTHFHTDHTGGLLTLRRAFMAQNPKAFSTVYVAQGFFDQRYTRTGEKIYSLPNPGFTESFTTPDAFRRAAEALGIEFTVVDEPLELRPGVVLSGPVARIHDEKNVGAGFFLQANEDVFVPDTVPESQVLGLHTRAGWVLLSGCGHAGIINAAEQLRAIKAQPVTMAVGGFHLFQANDATIAWTGAALQRFGVQQFVGAHCTGAYATRKLADILELPHSAVSMGAIGTRIDPSLNIVPSSIE
jgi:7,8-dihydropterin-6-yl-methyl-4-(beta-D-ribofuranosyl)aminobenzene 5'-phosphate synthase